jgi:hypothetical protein
MSVKLNIPNEADSSALKNNLNLKNQDLRELTIEKWGIK